MTYRRRQGLSRSSTLKEEILRQTDHDDATTSSAALPHRASDPRLDSFRFSGAFHSFKNRSKSSSTFDHISLRSMTEPEGFWGVLARKAKSIVEDDSSKQSNTSGSKKPETVSFSTSRQFTGIQLHHQHESFEKSRKLGNPKLKMELNKLMPSLSQIDDTIGNALETEKKTHNLHNSRRAFDNQENKQNPRMQSAQPQRNQDTQLQASRDLTLAMAAKVKQLARELKIVTAELASTNKRCSQLEEENKLLQAGREQRDHPADNMIQVQLETLLAEKGCLAHENLIFARENRYLRERVEFHQLKMQDMMYLDEGINEISLDPVEEPDS